MEYAKYLGLLDKQHPLSSKCGYCGSSVLLDDQKNGVCHLCEGYISPNILDADTKMVAALSKIQKLIDTGKRDEAIKSLDQLVSESVDPKLLYGSANIYKTISDIQYHDLDYNRKGFMEQNSSNIYSSLDSISKSKEMFYKAIRIMEDKAKSQSSETLLYLSFVSYIKLKRFVDAKKTLSSMKKDEASLARGYADMVYSLETKREDAYMRIVGLIGKGDPNAVYYLARYYVQNKKLKEAKAVLERLTEKVRMPMAVFLLHNVDRLMEETKL